MLVMNGSNPCPACGSVETARRYRLFDDRYGFPGIFHYQWCQQCGHAFCENPLEEKEFESLYTTRYPRAKVDPATHKPHSEPRGFRAWLNGTRRSAYCYVPRGVRVLDIGCGTCESLGYHASRGCRAVGVESDSNVSKIAVAHGYDVKIGLFSPEEYGSDSFDYVTLDQVFEHMTDPLACLLRISSVLRPGGAVVISTPNMDGWGVRFFGKKWINWHAPYHLNLFTPDSLSRFAGSAGFDIRDIKTLTSSDWLHFQWCHVMTYPTEAVASDYWTNRPPQKQLTRLLLKGCSLVHAMKINHLLTRFFDLIGKGDNIVAILEKRCPPASI